MKPILNPLRCALAGLALTASGLVPATAQEAPIELTSDNAEVNDATGVSVYRGNVVLTRGEMEITGGVMTVITDAERELDRIVVEGKPATYREPLPDAATRQAEAPRMEYYATGPERLILLNGGRLWQGDNEVIGETITHYPTEARTVAEGTRDSDRRVNVTVYPESETD